MNKLRVVSEAPPSVQSVYDEWQRAPELLMIDRTPPHSDGRTWTARQIVDDHEARHDWAIVAAVDLGASDAVGEPVIRTLSFEPAG